MLFAIGVGQDIVIILQSMTIIDEVEIEEQRGVGWDWLYLDSGHIRRTIKETIHGKPLLLLYSSLSLFTFYLIQLISHPNNHRR